MIQCDYCGKERDDATAPCPGCGTPPPRIPDDLQDVPVRPLPASGLFHCAIGALSILTGNLHGALGILHGIWDINSPDEPEDDTPQSLLQQAAVMESVDMKQAIVLYQHIAMNYTGTPAADEANRNIQTIRAAHPELEAIPAGPLFDAMKCTSETGVTQQPDCSGSSLRLVEGRLYYKQNEDCNHS